MQVLALVCTNKFRCSYSFPSFYCYNYHANNPSVNYSHCLSTIISLQYNHKTLAAGPRKSLLTLWLGDIPVSIIPRLFMPWIWILIITTIKTSMKLNTAKLVFPIATRELWPRAGVHNVTLRTTWRINNNYGRDLCIRDYHVYEEICWAYNV